jgi:hypothetical protein
MDSVDVDAVRNAWEQAAGQLGIEIETGISLEGNGGHHDVIALVRGFGRPTGTIILAPQDPSEARRAAEQQGFFVSILSSSYERYDRELFEATLNDWQWLGEGEPPDWYTGQPWSG